MKRRASHLLAKLGSERGHGLIFGASFLLALLAVWFVDGAGLFLYLAPGGYWFLRALSMAFIASAFFWSFRHKTMPPGMIAFAGTGAILLLAFIWFLPSLPTSPRKGFYLSFERARRAKTISELKKILARYPVGEAPLPPGEFVAYYSDGKQTLDVIHVSFEERTGRVEHVSISLD